MKLNILQVCRIFGPVGGMEKYVWELSRGLAKRGHKVHVLCEENRAVETIPGITVHCLKKVSPKPRWLAHIRFSQHIHQWLTNNYIPHRIIHSHERCKDHHITTFHGPPFALMKNKVLWKYLSLRVNMNLRLEKRELCQPNIQKIIPNSALIAKQIVRCYPTAEKHLADPIPPGVQNMRQRVPHTMDIKGGYIGFVGKEWKRKGLILAITIISKLFKQRPNLTFVIVGPDPQHIQHLFKNVNFNFQLLGKTNTNAVYSQLDVLIHPASKEPYGMVITEALSSGVPVVISNLCGACTEVSSQRGSILSINDDINKWSEAIDTWLNNTSEVSFCRSWETVVLEYEKIYHSLKVNS